MTLGGISRCNQIINVTYHNTVKHYNAWILYYNFRTNETTFVNLAQKLFPHYSR